MGQKIVFDVKRLDDADLWTASTDGAMYRVIRKDDKPGLFVAQECKIPMSHYETFMSANTLGAALKACQARTLQKK